MSVRDQLAIAMTVLVMMSGVQASAQHKKTFFSISNTSDSHSATCASNDIHQRLMQEDSDYAEQFYANEEEIQRRMGEFVNTDRSGAVVTIPVVVHIIHKGEPIGVGTNISNAQIQSAIVALNEDFRKTPGTNGFGSGVDTELEFCLASRAPDGSPTDGIVRVDGSGVPLYANEGISVGQGDGADEVSIKDLSRWPREQYYNIWIVNEIEDNDGGAGIQGFAYFPASSATKDGAVILYNAFGTVGTLKSYTALNRTTTHELGHAFYLYHTFQGSTCNEANCSTQGDRVCDTPPTTSNTNCSSPACSGTQQVENYMDYTSQSCMNMFTQGQKDRMHANLNLFRSSLLSSQGCVPPNTHDAAITDISEPETFSCGTNVSPVVTLRNYGSVTLSSVAIRYRLDGGSPSTFNWTGSLPASSQTEVTLPAMNTTIGVHQLEVYTESPNGQTDGYQSNDLSSKSFESVNGNMVNVSIEVDNYGGETTWEIADDSGNVIYQDGPYPSGINGTYFDRQVCLPLDCFDFTIYDSYGDGIWGGGGFGGYTVTDQDGNVLASGGDFAAVETTNFCLSASSSPPVADFTSNVTSGCSGSTFDFTDLSTGGVTSWSWTFTGGSPATSNSSSPTGISFSGSGGHTVSLTVSNANGSDTETKTSYITINNGLNISGQATDPSCSNANDGAINVSVSGGMTPYQYLWSSGSSAANLNGLGAGNYTLTVSDASGCSATQVFNLSAPSAISLQTSSSSASCGNDGSAVVSASGGTPPYSYLWNDDSMQTTSSASGLAGGQYSVVVTDANGCQANANVQVQSSGGVSIVSLSGSDVSCSSLGTATVVAQGGSTPYSYSWNNGISQTSATVTGLGAGTYTVTVTDANLCSSSQSITISESAGLDLSNASTTDASCEDDGTATVQPSGGTPPYSYEWSDSQSQTTQTAINLAAGQYTVTVSDTNGCQEVRNVTVNGSEPLEVSGFNTTSSSCQNNGSATVFVSGGTPPFTYLWNDSQMQTSATASGLAAGDYNVIITDANGCQLSHGIEVSSVQGMDLSDVWSSDATCADNGSCGITVSGGTPPYDFLWNDDNNSNSSQINGLTAGSYTVVVTDANGCISTTTILVNGADGIDLSNTSSTQSSCNNDGTATVSPSGGTAPYTYQWNDPQSQSTATATGLSGGDYAVVVTDANGCSSTTIIVVSSSSDLDLSNCGASTISCHGGSDGTAIVQPTGGTPPYTYSWNDASAQTSQQATGLSAGTYAVVVTDASGCQSMKSLIVSEPDMLMISFLTDEPSCHGGDDGEIEATISGGNGGYNYTWSGVSGNAGTLSLSGLSAGEYLLDVTDASGCQASSFITMSEPQAIVAQIVESFPDSCDLGVGRVILDVDGGTGQPSIVWDDEMEQVGEVLANVRAGIYTASITDMNFCEATKSVEVVEVDCTGATSLREVGDKTGFKLYPNPLTDDLLNIRFMEAIDEDATLSIYDSNGKIIQSVVIPAYTRLWELELYNGYVSGLYLIRIAYRNTTETRRLTIYR